MCARESVCIYTDLCQQMHTSACICVVARVRVRTRVYACVHVIERMCVHAISVHIHLYVRLSVCEHVCDVCVCVHTST